jgi:hypothetical protein
MFLPKPIHAKVPPWADRIWTDGLFKPTLFENTKNKDDLSSTLLLVSLEAPHCED